MRLSVTVKMPPSLAREVKSKIDKVRAQSLVALQDFARDMIASEADIKLKGMSATEYKRALYAPDATKTTEDSVTIRLTGDLPVALEQGFPSFDIKQKMLARATKRGKDGKPYTDVAFRHGQPGSVIIAPMPESVASSMKAAVRQAKRAFAAGGGNTSLAAMMRVRTPGKTAGKTITKTLNPITTIHQTTHKQGIYDAMLRIPFSAGKSVSSTYMTIRRISLNSQAGSWIHPGFRGVKIFADVVDRIKKAAPQIVQNVMSRLV